MGSFSRECIEEKKKITETERRKAETNDRKLERNRKNGVFYT